MPNDATAEKAGSAEHGDDAIVCRYHDSKFANLCGIERLSGCGQPPAVSY
jgi:hypothetical protein